MEQEIQNRFHKCGCKMHPSTRRPENEYFLFLKKNVKAHHATKLEVCTKIFDEPKLQKGARHYQKLS